LSQARFAPLQPGLTEQQGWPAPPHVTHCVPLHATWDAVQRSLAQHICDEAPQVPQLPLVHMPPTCGQVLPLPTHRSLTQQPLEPHAPPTQQGSPGLPQWLHTPLLQELASPHLRPGQQACPGPPQAAHVPPTQAPVEQVLLLQQGPPTGHGPLPF
jgi:hypothetical protein